MVTIIKSLSTQTKKTIIRWGQTRNEIIIILDNELIQHV